MSNKMYLIVLATVLAFACADLVQRANFAGYGPSFGDSRAASCDDCYFGPYNFDFIFYGDNRSSLYVSNNGIISFNGGISTYTPVGMSAANFPAIAVFWADVYTSISNGGSVWVGYRTDASILASLSTRVSNTFHAVRAFVVTYDNVAYYANNNKHNNFQAVLLADAIGNSWVLLNYADMEWTTGSASGGNNGLGGTPGSVGFSNGAGTYVQTPESLTGDVINTRDSVTQVNGVTIVLPPSQVCGNGEREGTEDCDGDACCNADCTFKNDASCFCGRQTYVGGEYAMNYFCVPGDVNSFYQCLQGPWASQSRIMPCGAGTHCGCPIGEDCSCGGARTPCIGAEDSFYC